MSQVKKRRVLKKLKQYNTIWHPDSALVFKSQKERVVIGRLEDEELVHLDNTAVELSKEWGFKIDQEMLEKLEESGEESNEESGEESAEKNSEEESAEDEEQSENRSENESEDQQDNKEETTPVEQPLNVTFDFVENFNTITAKLGNFLTSNSKIISEKDKQIEKLQKEFDLLSEKYDKINKKFETMKSLFN